jgi:hypothetical protein
VFQAEPAARIVEVTDVPAIDPQQTELPAEWRGFPAFVVAKGATMKLDERRRGDADPAPDELSLERTLWLDFDGRGYTAHDAISGRLSRSWRLEMAEPVRLGRVSVYGRDQLITRLPGTTQTGVEVRPGAADLNADSRIEGSLRSLPAVGWAHDFARVHGRLMLPPGWRLLHAGGVDDPSPTWLEHWTMLEIFLALITALAVAQLHGRVWGAVALVALVLLYPEPGAPRYVWLFLLGTDALTRVVPDNRLKLALRALGLGSAVVLLAIAVPFAVGQLRAALYPSLEWDSVARSLVRSLGPQAVPMQTAPAPASEPESFAQGMVSELKAERRAEEQPRREKDLASASSSYYEQEPGALISTGPGLPSWQWRTIDLTWNGPVTHAQTLRLWLVPPWLNFVLGFVRVGLLAVLTLVALGLHGLVARGFGGSTGAKGLLSGLVTLGLLTLGASSARCDELPPQNLLDALSARLTEKPGCLPDCVTSPRLRLDVTGDHLRAQVELHTQAHSYAPLPGGANDWLPDSVTVDGKPAAGLARDTAGVIWVELTAGVHQIVLEGRLPPRETVQLPLPLRPARVEASVAGWVLSGIHEDGRADAALQLARSERSTPQTGERLQPSELPPFARVTRSVHLGLLWTVDTRVQRLSPSSRALVLSVPLLPGESVTSEAVRVADGLAQVSLAPGVREVGWSSTLAQAPSLALRAAEGSEWSEILVLDVAPLWHGELKGIPPIAGELPRSLNARVFWPWPGERVDLTVTRPEATAGPTLTLDRAELQLKPGLRAYDASLELAVRASRGDTHAITLPEGAELQGVLQDGNFQPISLVDQRVVLPVAPGAHTASIRWRAPVALSMLTRTPLVDLGAPAVNASLAVSLSSDRWLLLVGGPRLGPAVLFWGMLVVAALLAVGLARTRLTPLGVGSWFLLFVGLSQVPIYLALVVTGWLLALGWRRDHAASDFGVFDFLQIVLGLWTFAALASLVVAVHQGLLGLPEMQIAGNGSRPSALSWYQDRTGAELPRAWVISVPLFVYRLAMLAWALWLARALLRWLRWGYDSFISGGAWRTPERRTRPINPRPPPAE